MTLPRTLEPLVYVSWDGSGEFDGEFDDVIDDVAAEPGLTIVSGRQDSLTLSPPRVGDGGLELLNEDGRYSQERADSPVYQRVLPGRPVLYVANHGEERNYDSDVDYDADVYYDGSVEFGLGRHVVNVISQATELGARRVALETIGYETVLTRAVVTVPLQQNVRTDQCVTLLLDAAGWPADKRSIAVGDTTVLVWWCDERHPWDALLDLLGTEGPGTFYVDRDGVFHWENRNYRTTATRSQISQATFEDQATSNLFFAGLQYDPGFRNVRNRTTYATRRRTTGSLQKVWEYGASLNLIANQSRTLFARPTNPFVSAVSPQAGTDYTVSAGSATVSLTYSSGFVAFIVVTAGAGGATIDGVTSTGIQLRAQPLTVLSETTVQNSVDASESIDAFSPVPGASIPLVLTVAGWPEVDPASAEAVCNAWVNRYQVPRPLVTIRITNADGAHLEQILKRQVSDRITLVEANTGLSADAWINSMQLLISGAGGRIVELVLGCEICDELTGAIWDVSEWDDPTSVWGV